MKLLTLPSFLLLFFETAILSNFVTADTNVHYLDNNEFFKFSNPRQIYGTKPLHIFCYQGKPKYIIHIWQSVILYINHSTDDYNQFDGGSPEHVEKEYLEKRYSWTSGLFSSKSKTFHLNPFNTSCIGIESQDTYSVHLKIIRVDLWNILKLVAGIVFFLSAPTLSKNTLFHYVCGVSSGVCASFLILIYFLSKLFPRKTFMYGVIGAGWTLVIYFLQILWDNMKTILSLYRTYVIWYIVITGTISFILCYRWGPVQNQRTMNLIKWSLQLLGLLLIFFSSHFQEAAMAQVILLLLFTYVPKRWVLAPKMYWKKRFPPKLKPISNDEYYEQGVRETAKALDDLRKYCSSPECNQWKTALKLKDVKRFASFIEGNSHLSDEEILEYETSIREEVTDDSDNGEDAQFSEDESS
ncbi:nuclear envelope integral membrane protein 1 [Sitophilus oryzae]|uniref:Nuclear envelope integral membrane protein 1 n=1 Tax=Sitophilus oryzae TaxID=7048 RepID=A0A6J2XYF4_SITOR|nr:nuclear envelope integral membrane protein 1 [Sitophilus oryzae]